MGNFKEDVAKVKAFVFDVDGVFTDGGIIPLKDGDFMRKYNAKDGYAVAYALKQGYKICIITGGRGESLKLRFQLLGVTKMYINSTDKITDLTEFMAEEGLAPEEVMFMGDDIPDIEAMRHVGMPVCPADAATEIVEICRYVSQFDGGRGCVRDVVEQVLRARGDWMKDLKGVLAVPSA